MASYLHQDSFNDRSLDSAFFRSGAPSELHQQVVSDGPPQMSVRKSLVEINAEKRKKWEAEQNNYGGITNNIMSSPFKAHENLALHYNENSPSLARFSHRTSNPYEKPTPQKSNPQQTRYDSERNSGNFQFSGNQISRIDPSTPYIQNSGKVLYYDIPLQTTASQPMLLPHQPYQYLPINQNQQQLNAFQNQYQFPQHIDQSAPLVTHNRNTSYSESVDTPTDRSLLPPAIFQNRQASPFKPAPQITFSRHQNQFIEVDEQAFQAAETRKQQLANELRIQMAEANRRKQEDKQRQEAEDIKIEERLQKEREELAKREQEERQKAKAKEEAQQERLRMFIEEQKKQEEQQITQRTLKQKVKRKIIDFPEIKTSDQSPIKVIDEISTFNHSNENESTNEQKRQIQMQQIPTEWKQQNENIQQQKPIWLQQSVGETKQVLIQLDQLKSSLNQEFVQMKSVIERQEVVLKNEVDRIVQSHRSNDQSKVIEAIDELKKLRGEMQAQREIEAEQEWVSTSRNHHWRNQKEWLVQQIQSNDIQPGSRELKASSKFQYINEPIPEKKSELSAVEQQLESYRKLRKSFAIPVAPPSGFTTPAIKPSDLILKIPTIEKVNVILKHDLRQSTPYIPLVGAKKMKVRNLLTQSSESPFQIKAKQGVHKKHVTDLSQIDDELINMIRFDRANIDDALYKDAKQHLDTRHNSYEVDDYYF